MVSRTHRKQGFTLVEILIVVVILGILAAIVIPQFTNASESAKSSSLVSQLQTIRSQLELYQVQHNGNYPTLVDEGTTDWTPMTEASGGFGPYLQQAPLNPFTNSSAVTDWDSTADGAGDPAGADDANGWFYDSSNGRIMAAKFDEAAQEEL